MASTVAKGILPYTMGGTGNTPVLYAPEAASFTGIRGTPLKFSSGYLTTISADENFGTAEGVIVGVSIEAGHNNSSAGDTSIGYWPAFPHVLFEVTLEDETNNDHVLAATNMGGKFALQHDTTNDRWYLDENDVAVGEAAMRVIGFIDAVGTTKGRVVAAFINEATVWSSTLT